MMASSVPPPPPPNIGTLPQTYNQRFQSLIARYELDPRVAADLWSVLAVSDVILLCDDSGSMGSQMSDGSTLQPVNPFSGANSTRWTEQQRLVAQIVEFVTAVQENNSNGCQVHFLHRAPIFNVQQASQLQQAFSFPPAGVTPLYTRLSQIIQNTRVASGRNLLIIVIGDGEPSDCTHPQLRALLNNKPPYCHISFAECTTEDEDMAWLDQYDGVVPNFDNNDAYPTERIRVAQAMGPNYKFNYQSYVCKIILASFLRWWFVLDQSRQSQQMPFWYQPRRTGNFNFGGNAYGQPGVGGYNAGGNNYGQPGVGGYNAGGNNYGQPGVGGYNAGGNNYGQPGYGGYNPGVSNYGQPGVEGYNAGVNNYGQPGYGGYNPGGNNYGQPGVGGYNPGVNNYGQPGVGGYNAGGNNYGQPGYGGYNPGGNNYGQPGVGGYNPGVNNYGQPGVGGYNAGGNNYGQPGYGGYNPGGYNPGNGGYNQ